MTEPLTRQKISEAVDPLGWRLLLGAVVTHVPVSSLSAAVDAAAAVVSVGTKVDGHLNVDLHADRVELRLQTEAAHWVSDHDLELARLLTEALAARSLSTLPGDAVASTQTLEIAIDALDIPGVRPFWQAVTGYVDEPSPTGPTLALMDPLGRGAAIWFQQMNQPRPQRNRIHLDVVVPPELARPRIDAALAAGGRMVSDAHAPAFWVLADPEGNEVCVCTWQGRD